MTPEQHQSLIDQFDQCRGQQSHEEPYPGDVEGQREWELLERSVDAIQRYAITEEVRKGRMRFGLEQQERERARVGDMTPVRQRFSPVLQVAAILIVAVVTAAVIKVANTRPESVFDKNYSDYHLNVTRGADVGSSLEQAYQSGNWAAVYTAFAANRAKTQKDYFLTAMAHMRQKEYYESISLLKVLMQSSQTGEPFFEDEAEYYLAMNYLATGQAAPAVVLFDKIKADPRHVYHTRVMQMSALDLEILRMK